MMDDRFSHQTSVISHQPSPNQSITKPREARTPMNLLTTFAGSMMEGFLPKGWDLARIDACASHPPAAVTERQGWWHPSFEPIPCASLADFDVKLGHEIALTIRRTRESGRKSALILPVGPMGMYRWAVYFLKEWGIGCDHVHGFNMDEWSDRDGQTLPANDPAPSRTPCNRPFTARWAIRPSPSRNAGSPRPIACPITPIRSPN